MGDVEALGGMTSVAVASGLVAREALSAGRSSGTRTACSSGSGDGTATLAARLGEPCAERSVGEGEILPARAEGVKDCFALTALTSVRSSVATDMTTEGTAELATEVPVAVGAWRNIGI